MTIKPFRENAEFAFYERKDLKGRKVEVTLEKDGSKLNRIRICTVIAEDFKYKEDYYWWVNSELFIQIYEGEIRKDPELKRSIEEWLQKG